MKRRYLFSLAVVGSAAVLFAAWAITGPQGSAPESSPGSPKALPAAAAGLKGAVVYHHRGGIYKTVLGTTKAVPLAKKGAYPRWSPDGRHVVFLDGHRVMQVDANGEGLEVLATVEEPRVVNYHPNGEEVLFTDAENVKSVHLPSGEVRVVAEGFWFGEIDINRDSSRLIATVKRFGYELRAFDLARGRNRSFARGCSASLSPDATLVTNLGGDHKELALRAWSDGNVRRVIHAPPGLKFDNQFWSNHPDWIASQSEGDASDIYIHRVSTDTPYRATFTGDCSRPDLFVTEAPTQS